MFRRLKNLWLLSNYRPDIEDTDKVGAVLIKDRPPRKHKQLATIIELDKPDLFKRDDL